MALVALPMATRSPDSELTPRHSTQFSAATPSSSSASFPSVACFHCTRLSFSRKAATGRTGRGGVCRATSAQVCSQEAVEDWYEVLGVQRNATAKEVKAAYRQLVRRFHPDVAAEQDKQDSTSRFLQVHQAYAVLSDPQAKAAFDLQLSMHRFQTSGYSTSRQGFPGLSTSFSGYAGYAYSTSATAVPSDQAFCGSGFGYGYAYPASAVDNQGFTSYATASYPSVSGSKWKGTSWETDQCW
eukprot:TRINITY_DN14357_c0_g1_i1.p1 TRINITY_DN14357_c0_g1~~TRINITY_DN14357_c0_g1_i1.p1  ORF type:complete len:266 (-),score=4.69 TRINITY_DN14357_c0_g1_i1:393-1115(-)